MRTKRTVQTSLFDPQALNHPVVDELEWASARLDPMRRAPGKSVARKW